jgi:hypothetical protein
MKSDLDDDLDDDLDQIDNPGQTDNGNSKECDEYVGIACACLFVVFVATWVYTGNFWVTLFLSLFMGYPAAILAVACIAIRDALADRKRRRESRGWIHPAIRGYYEDEDMGKG